ncbi:MAG: 5-formyltetrahydrofolate cyclo-ligase [Lachnospiraceae bacterium]|nr:5-formyltetrahydrofolate cyclo-ligase [Lachnospiraceae bacterium]
MSEEKKALRKDILKLRDALAYEQRDNDAAAICDLLFMHPAVLSAKKILLFASFGSEPDTDPIAIRALDMGKEIYYPRVEDKDISFYAVKDITELKSGYKGIREPATERPWDGEVKDSVVLVPGTAFDKYGRRMGYGGGFYDRFLKAHPGIYSIGICFELQLLESIPEEDHDEKVNDIIYGY